ncbi:chromosome partitioning protein, ParB family [Oscillibacter sp. PC13]|uniref:ParB/RepB/Spo0J family partition protein n=1 Tax=Oscillibacter sp. PC13 TaxID=1855299 RepID=UPI0008E82784|nr:ParB/RepB/Spo0J family partition protein [Oscillibacter sp. PC13]SFP78599.1 chromosome partitioning protein, ParB family [Oscillibacter sp. PC13]
MEPKEQRVLQLRTEEIRPNPRQPRQVFDKAGLQELSDSILRHGILQPLTVRQTGTGWELVAGERRLRAARLAGLETVPCLESAADDRDAALLALVENLQRRDLHYFEEATAIAAFLRETGQTQEETAAQLGKSPSAVANKLRLLRLSPACRALLTQEGLSERHARCLLRLEEESERLSAARHIAAAHLSVAQAEAYVERRLAALQSTLPAGRRTYIIKDVRLFLNSVDRGLRLIRDAGVDAVSGREETEDAILLTIRIPKQRRAPPAKEA